MPKLSHCLTLCIILAALALYGVSPALADCKARIAEIDVKLEAMASGDPSQVAMAQVVQHTLDRAAESCAGGDEARAEAQLQNVDMMLSTFTTPSAAATPEPAPEAVPFTDAETLYLSDAGEGILRYSVAEGGGREYTLVTGALTGYADMPIETIGSSGARYRGPDIAVWIWGLGQGIPIEKLILTLYDIEAQKRYPAFPLRGGQRTSRAQGQLRHPRPQYGRVLDQQELMLDSEGIAQAIEHTPHNSNSKSNFVGK